MTTNLPTRLDRTGIEAAIPHRPPFLLVDAIDAIEENAIEGRWRPAADAFWFQGHYPSEPVTPGVLLTEHALQTAAVLVSLRLAGFGEEDGIPVLSKLGGARFRRIVRPEEEVTTRVEVTERVGPAWFMKAKLRCDGQRVAEIEFVLTATAAAARAAGS
ncbi:3-hydroxyacyl-[acyl-carrier-protein] dehydratase FabZ [Planctomycetes bacterium Pla163]|uniref:3-hydroxyacyl-[acyl-carrier-protein] dehydratase FabZ n=1 Tax=Rohdeia mirabilis TaxID=2528008 RepID=A0A518CYR8_9BACT|nr:3-hydroxyacyl-[acyl-carrier-protein] dehydratase FabZ [Planctomycetes bacterium Pla163]